MDPKVQSLRITSEIEVYASENDLPESEKMLLQTATIAAEKAYAPYSKFHVGAAVMLENGKIISGNNQENAAYPAGLCAERVALFYASAEYPATPVKMIAVTCKTIDRVIDQPVSPCGSCRQALTEYEQKYNSPIRIIMKGEIGKVYVCNGISQLLPLQFNRNNL